MRLQKDAEVQVRNRIRCNENLKTDEPLRQVLVHVTPPNAAAIGCHDMLPNAAQHFHQETTRAGSRIQNERVLISEPIRLAEFRFEQRIHRADNVRNHGLRRVVDTSLHAPPRGIFSEERLVKVNNRICGMRARVKRRAKHLRRNVPQKLHDLV